jgi:hypothetical protein
LENSLPIENDRFYTVWDPFMGTGTTGVVCGKNGRCRFYGGNNDATLIEEASSQVVTAFLHKFFICFLLKEFF